MEIRVMQGIVIEFFEKLGVKTNFVFVQPTNATITAATIGLKSDRGFAELLGFTSPAVAGVIQVNEKDLQVKKFTDSEINFILAHECIHIFNSHVVSTTFWYLLEKYLKGENLENAMIIEFVKIILAFRSKSGLPPNAETLRDQEYEADKLAVLQLTRDIDSAISCLTKLANGDLDSPSHTWELFDKAVPAMNMRQRIEMLRKNVLGI